LISLKASMCKERSDKAFKQLNGFGFFMRFKAIR
jgi:hypothetical protein